MTATPERPVLGAVLFDLDDTLHDDTGSQLDGARRVAAEIASLHPGFDPQSLIASYIDQSNAFWKAFGSDSLTAPLGDVRAMMWGRALRAAGVPGDGTLARMCGKLYYDHRRERFELFPEALGLLAELRVRGVKIGMITNGLAETHREKIVLLKLESLFDLVFIADEVGLAKPDPRLFTLACERLALPPDRCAMVGDRYERDIRAPLGLGMFAIWTNIRGESVPAGEPAPDADLPSLAGVMGALLPYLPPAPHAPGAPQAP